MSVVIPFSKNIRTANLTVTVGTILFDEASKVSVCDACNANNIDSS